MRGGSVLVRRRIQTPSDAKVLSVVQTGGGGRPRSFPSGPPHIVRRSAAASRPQHDDLRADSAAAGGIGRSPTPRRDRRYVKPGVLGSRFSTWLFDNSAATTTSRQARPLEGAEGRRLGRLRRVSRRPCDVHGRPDREGPCGARDGSLQPLPRRPMRRVPMTEPTGLGLFQRAERAGMPP